MLISYLFKYAFLTLLLKLDAICRMQYTDCRPSDEFVFMPLFNV